VGDAYDFLTLCSSSFNHFVIIGLRDHGRLGLERRYDPWLALARCECAASRSARGASRTHVPHPRPANPQPPLLALLTSLT
jgi:hypothetical protein